MRVSAAVIAALGLVVGVHSQPSFGSQGRIEMVHVPAPSLANNRFAMPAEQPVAVYLPPSYDSTNSSYAVVYYLPGFGDPIAYYTAYGVYQGFALRESLDSLIRRDSLPELMVVLISTVTPLGGSFGVNSPVLGNWEDYIANDVVGFIDHHYRTKAEPRSRGIAGHSAGGYGALSLAMHRPDVYGAAYALSPGLFAPGALKENFMFADTQAIRTCITTEAHLRQTPAAYAKLSFVSLMMQLVTAETDWRRVFTYAYGATFAPDTTASVPYIDYPYSLDGEHLVRDSSAWNKFEDGFGGLAAKVNLYRGNLARLAAIGIDVGTRDEYAWIPRGCDYLSKLLTEAGIAHQLIKYDGSHQDHLRERIEGHMLPFFTRVLR